MNDNSAITRWPVFDPLDRETVRKLFEPYSPAPLSDADCEEIDRTVRGFFEVLLKWKRYSRTLRNEPGAVVVAGGPEVDAQEGPRGPA